MHLMNPSDLEFEISDLSLNELSLRKPFAKFVERMGSPDQSGVWARYPQHGVSFCTLPASECAFYLYIFMADGVNRNTQSQSTSQAETGSDICAAYQGKILYRGKEITGDLLSLDSDEIYPYMESLNDEAIFPRPDAHTPKGYFTVNGIGTLRLCYNEKNQLDNIVI